MKGEEEKLPERNEDLSPGEKEVMARLQKAVNAVMTEAGAVLEGRYKSIAITHLETAHMFFNRAIAVDGIK
jgi:hypothetical protein